MTNYKDLFNLKGKNIVVLGGAGLIGGQIARALSEFDAHVSVIDLKRPADLDAQNESIEFYEADATDDVALRDTLAQVIKKNQHVHGLVHSAYPRTSDWGVKFEKIPTASWKENLDGQLGTCFIATQVMAEHMKEKGSGSIVLLGSTYGVVGPDFSIYAGTEMTMPAAYSAIKGGVINFTRYLAAYYGRHNVRVNCLSPGGILDRQPASFVERYSQKTPLGRMGQPQEIAAAVVFLISEAASYVTGHNLMVDGGWTAW